MTDTTPAARTLDPPRPNSGGAYRRLSNKAVARERLAALAFLAPDLIGFGIFVTVPIVLSLSLGLFDVSGFGGYNFVGLDNYVRLANDAQFHQSITVTSLYVVITVPGMFIAGLGLALLTKRPYRGVGIVRAMFFLPHVVSLVVVGLIWQFMLVDELGSVNRLLQAMGLSSVSWLGDPAFALPTVMVVTIWFYMGYYMIIFLAGLQDIPRELYDAAKIDGAKGAGLFRHITWPLLKPTSFFVLLMSTVAAVAGAQAFDLIYVMTKGGPASSTKLALFYIYEQAFRYNDFGYAAAMASVLVLTLIILTGGMFLLTRGGKFQ